MTASHGATSRVSDVLAGLPDIRGWQEEFYRDLHSHPELSHQERRTAARIVERLTPAGFEVHEGVGGTGVVGVSAADSMRIIVHGQGAHGSMPQAAVDPVVLAASIVLRLQTVVSRELAPGEPAVLTVGSVQAGAKSNVIPDSATLLLNMRTYSDTTRRHMLDAIQRIVTAECRASLSPRDPEFEQYERYPLTDNDAAVTSRVADAFAAHFGNRAGPLPRQSASEDFSDIPNALGTPYTYWGIGGIDPDIYRTAEQAGRVNQDIPVNHSAAFAPVMEPTLATGTEALVAAALAWL